MFASSIAYPVTYVKTNTWFYEILIIWWEIWIPLSDCCSGINFSLTEPCGVWGSHQYSYWCCFDFLTCKVSAVLSVWLDTLVYSCLISTLVTKIEGYILDDFCGHSFWCSKRNRVSPTCITDLHHCFVSVPRNCIVLIYCWQQREKALFIYFFK